MKSGAIRSTPSARRSREGAAGAAIGGRRAINPLTLENAAFSALFREEAVAARFSTARILDDFLRFERALTEAQAGVGALDPEAARQAVAALDGFAPDLGAIAAASVADGLPVPALVRQLKAHVGPDLAACIHPGATSQDLIDTAFALAIRDLNALLAERLAALAGALRDLQRRTGAGRLMARTRMQAALPVAAGARIALWAQPLEGALEDLHRIGPRIAALQLGGAVGDRSAFGAHGDEIARRMAEALGLANPPRAWHATRGAVAEYCGWLSGLTGALGKFGQDAALMAQQGIDEIGLGGGGASSAMPHKRNPVRAELLVTFARYNAAQLGGVHQALIHEQERSGAAWTLEWMIVPAMVMTTAKALDHAAALAASIERVGAAP